MNIKELSKWADDQVLAKTGERLDTLQKNILEGVLEHPNFCKIADNNGYSYEHIRKEGAKLWKLLSDVFDEDIKQCNVRSILENKYGSAIQIISSKIDNSCVTIRENPSSNIRQKKKRSPKTKSQNQSPIIDLKNEPQLSYNYGRKTEINTLKTWLENNTKLITIYGLSGIGKTALILKLIPEIKENFDYIIYRRLHQKLTLINLENDLKLVFEQTQPSELIDDFKNNRCLLILDDVHCIFKTGHLAGQYLPEFKDYSKFFQDIATLSHQSCIILISWEKPLQFTQLEANNFNVKTLHLTGLGEDSKEILREKDLKDEEKWDELISLYQGNPSWLYTITHTINNYDHGQVSQFLIDQDELFLDYHIESTLENHFERLSELEKNLINWLATQDQLIYINQKYPDLKLSKLKFLTVIESLIRRCLIEQITQENETKLQLNPIFKAYLNNYSR